MSKIEKMFSKDWYDKLEPFLLSPQFLEIGKTLSYESKQLKDITPPFELTFRAFKECSWSNLHTVILGMDPYPGKIDKTNYVADGIAFSSRLSQKAPKSLSYLFKAIEEDIYNNEHYEVKDYDLQRWSNQGILLLNCALSLPIGEKAGSHIELWRPFISKVIQVINNNKTEICFALMGAHAKKYKSLITNKTFTIFECEHPAAAAYSKGGIWKHDNIFTKITGYQKFMNNIEIKW